MKNQFSVVIPVFNQYEELNIVLHHFSQLPGDYEIIIVDDGSSDKLQDLDKKTIKNQYGISSLELIHQQNKGRSEARNKGVYAAQGQYIIFCDGDRIPNQKLVAMYDDCVSKYDIIIGGAMDCFAPKSQLYSADDAFLDQYARYPVYYKRVCEDLFNEVGDMCSSWCWLGFLVGNSCVKKEILQKVGGFSTDFCNWGFEHFELAYRIMRAGHVFNNQMGIKNYHIVHSRPKNFYKENIVKSIQLLCDKYALDQAKLSELFLGETNRYNFKIL